jgi:sugar lactone lactonase YvrE
LTRATVTLAADLFFGEAPRWREGSLYFADIHSHRVMAWRPEGGLEVVAVFEGPVSGLGWLPDGRMLVVSMHDRRLLRREPDGAFVEHADLSAIATWHANDMVVARDGAAYVGNFGFALEAPAEFKRASLACVSPLGAVSVAAADLSFPNGAVITPDDRTLIIAESAARRLTAFDLSPAGLLSNRRPWAVLPQGAFPDGICLDADGAVWAASPSSHEVLRIREGGEILERIPTEQQAIACMLGGDDRRTLFICTAESTDPAACKARPTARLLAVRVKAPGAGRP